MILDQNTHYTHVTNCGLSRCKVSFMPSMSFTLSPHGRRANSMTVPVATADPAASAGSVVFRSTSEHGSQSRKRSTTSVVGAQEH